MKQQNQPSRQPSVKPAGPSSAGESRKSKHWIPAPVAFLIAALFVLLLFVLTLMRQPD